MKRKNRPLCETPRSGYFCGPDKYLRLQEHTISEELFPVMEVDSYFVLVRSGSGSFIINGEEFPVRAGCVAWIQCSQVLTICPEFGDALKIWVAAFDYQLLSYYSDAAAVGQGHRVDLVVGGGVGLTVGQGDLLVLGGHKLAVIPN